MEVNSHHHEVFGSTPFTGSQMSFSLSSKESDEKSEQKKQSCVISCIDSDGSLEARPAPAPRKALVLEIPQSRLLIPHQALSLLQYIWIQTVKKFQTLPLGPPRQIRG
ncbi:hypothetical protein PAMP_016118 [Pampus punctatissimus]